MSEIASLRFLVVEDHGFQRWLIGNLLERLGARSVYCVGEGCAALEVLAKLEGIDVVVTDLDMPGMDGMQLIRHLGQLSHPAALIVVSALQPPLLATVESMSREYGVGLLAAIQKPLTAKKLQAAIALHRSPEARGSRPAFSAKEIEEALRSGEFEAFFQPKVEIKSGRMRGAEALARWRHPTRGYVSPDAFIGIAESHGLVDTLTDRMVQVAALNCRAWRDLGLELAVSVNLSSMSLSDTSLAERITALVFRAGIEPRHVTLEITESAASPHMGPKLENLVRLRMNGFGLSIDDYGTGYSSMHRLATIPFTELKIEQVFVRNAAGDRASRAMVESSVEVAQKLRITAVAEGVETQAQWEMLRALGCPLAQGYAIAMPMPAGEFLEWARARRGSRVCGET